MEVVTLNELYVVQHWKYRAEGNANLLVEYIGPIAHFRNTLLRLRKVEKLAQDTTPDFVSNKKDISSESLFISTVANILLGQEFVEQQIAITLPTQFLIGIAEAVDHTRPKFRLHKTIDLSQAVGFLALDHARFIKPSAQPSICAEIKPKWGFLTASAFIRNDQLIKRRKCRFCMYQHQKFKIGQEKSISGYCPIDLFSGRQALIEDSLDALMKTPQNNLKIFIDGVEKPITELKMTQSPIDSQSEQLQLPPLTDIIARILTESPLLKRLSRLQQGLDSLDVETIHRFYKDLADPISGAIANPTVEDYLRVAEAFLERTELDDMMDESDEAFIKRNAESLGFGPEDVEEGEIPDALKLHYIYEFLLSCTLKDCSILITIRRGSDEEEFEEVSSSDSATTSFHAESLERNHTMEMDGVKYVYKIICVDLDPKKSSGIPKYLEKDREIVNHYLATIGDREPSCGNFAGE